MKEEKIHLEMFQSKCPKCGNVNVLTKDEIEKKVHCQCCYFHYDYHDPFSYLRTN